MRRPDFVGNLWLHCRNAVKSPSATQNMLHNLLKVAMWTFPPLSDYIMVNDVHMSCGTDSFIRGGGGKGGGGVGCGTLFVLSLFPFVSDVPPVSAECRVSQSIRKYESQDVSFNLLDFPS